MNPSKSREQAVKTGTFLYAGTIECDVRIVRSQVRYGTGDQSDSPKIAEDVDAETYYVQYGSTVQRGVFTSGSVACETLQDAMLAAESQLGPKANVRWHEGTASEA